MEGSEYSFSAEEGERDLTSRKKNKKKRFSEEQIRSLEGMFENETRLEPRNKVRLAKEVGLHPRQVAIWFQNKRARYKSKKLDLDYALLLDSYNNLASRFHNLNKENQALIIQLQKLNDLTSKCKGEGLGQFCIKDGSDNGDGNKVEFGEKPSFSLERSEQGIEIVSDDNDNIKAEYFAMEEEPKVVELVEPNNSSLTSAEDWGNIDSDDIFNQCSSSYQWWDFWS